MKSRLRASVLIALCGLAFAWSAAGQTYRIGTSYNVLVLGDGTACRRTWYDPEIFQLPSGDLKLLAQGGNPDSVCSGGVSAYLDSLFDATRSSASGAWTLPTNTSCPVVPGGYTRCGYSPTTPGPVASPSVVRVPGDSRYFMAFVGGNADYIKGKVYWAVSSDGVNWTVYNWNPPAGETWSPVLYSKYAAECQPNSIGQVQLAYENGLFYLYMQYWHPTGELSSVAYRFDYNSGHPFGFGPSVREVYQNGTWQHNSGHLVWSYDTGAAETGDQKLGVYTGMQQLEFGAGDVKYDPARGWWLHIYGWDHQIRSQHSSSLAAADWSAYQVVDTSVLTGASGRFPNTENYYPGVWYGTLSGIGPRMWIWVPVDYQRCISPFYGLALAPAQLDYS